MAAEIQKVSRSYVEVMEEGRIEARHQCEWIFTIPEALETAEYKEEMEYTTFCSSSSSWEIILKIEKELSFKNFNMLVTLKRDDLNPLTFTGTLVIWFWNVELRRCPLAYRVECVLKDQGTAFEVFAVDEHIRCLLREGDYLTFPDDKLTLKVQLFVDHCCRDSKRIWDPMVNKEYAKALSIE